MREAFLRVLELRALLAEAIERRWVTPAMEDRVEAACDAGDFALVASLIDAARSHLPGDSVWTLIHVAALRPSIAAAVGLVGVLHDGGWLHRAPPPGHPDRVARLIAARFAYVHRYQAPALLDAICDRHGTELPDLLGLLIQELVVRGVDLSGSHHLHALARFGDLPVARLPIELRLEPGAPRFARKSWSGWNLWPATPEVVAVPAPDVALRELPADPRIAAAFESQCQVSNGKAASHVFAVPPGATDVAVLRALPARAACLHGTPEPLCFTQLEPVEVFRVLFGFAANGGVYNQAYSAGHGRLATWRSLAGLIDAPDGTDLAQLEQLARPCRFFQISATAPWFYRVMPDLALVAMRAGGASLALLAGTDTD